MGQIISPETLVITQKEDHFNIMQQCVYCVVRTEYLNINMLRVNTAEFLNAAVLCWTTLLVVTTFGALSQGAVCFVLGYVFSREVNVNHDRDEMHTMVNCTR